MRLRLPLYGKILTWFFLNLLVVSAVVTALFTAQFHFNLDWVFFATGARERVEAVRNLIMDELEATHPDEWPQVLERYSETFHVRFALFDDEARPLVGGFSELPEEVRKRIIERPLPTTFQRRSGSSRSSPAPGGSPAIEANRADGNAGPERVAPPEVPVGATPRPGGESFRRGFRPPLRALMRTVDPTRYWVLASGRLESPLLGDPMRIVLVARSQTISGGGLIFDPKPWLLLGLGIVLFSLLFWWPLISSITRTIRRMMQTTRQIADGRFEVRVNLHRRDELGALSESIDQMAIRLDGLVAGQKRFLGDIAHELCSPLARLQMALGILEQKASADQEQFVQTASEKAQQISALVAELLSFSKASFGSSAVRLQSVPLREVIEEAVHREKTETSPEIKIAIEKDLCVSADPELLLRAFSNLIRNAVQHAGTAGPITIRATRDAVTKPAADGEDPDLVTVIVADQGPGVPPEELTKIFDAFYRLDTSRARATGGTGLGLAIVKTCIESCCGTVSARNGQPTGLEVHAVLHAGALA